MGTFYHQIVRVPAYRLPTWSALGRKGILKLVCIRQSSAKWRMPVARDQGLSGMSWHQSHHIPDARHPVEGEPLSGLWEARDALRRR